MRLHHVQVAIPAGGEPAAREFYAGLLGMDEIEKPEALRARGGCWFRSGTAEIHCGIDADFTPARKAHPALEVDEFDEACRALEVGGHTPRTDELLPGRRRCYVDDPFGNRIEIVASIAD